MTAQISTYGRLVADPQTRTANTGYLMALARLAVSLPCHSAQDGQATLWLGVIAFGKQAEALSQHVKGDVISVVGNMQISQWTGKDGGTQSGYQVVADSVISAKTVLPTGGNKSQAKQTPQEQQNVPAPEDEDQSPLFDDEHSF